MLMFIACAKKQPTVSPVERTNAEMAGKKPQIAQVDSSKLSEEADSVDEAPVPEGIEGIQQVWRDKPISLDTPKVDIQTMAKAFCEQYPGFEPNRVLRDHFDGQTKKTEEQDYYVNLEAPSGYVSIETTTELPTGTTLCFWNRRKGHKLLAAWMECQEEGKKAEHLLVFYDYDPNTKVMTPEPTLSDELTRITKKFPDWSLRLPSVGKDIEIMAFSGQDSAENFKVTYYDWKWNGQSFHFNPNGHE